MEQIEISVTDRIGYITLNRPDKRNALNASMIQGLTDAFAKHENDSSVKVIILKANGDAFCAGADLAYIQQLQEFSFEENLADSSSLKALFQKIYSLKKVVIAQVQGHALAGGCGLATVCDFIFTVPEAKFGYTEVKIGFIPAIVLVFLIRKTGEQRAKELLLSGELIPASRAAEIGLVSKVLSKETLAGDVSAFAKSLITNNSAESMALTKRMIAEVQSMSLDDALNYAAKMNATARGTDDCKKGIDAFLNKQTPQW